MLLKIRPSSNGILGFLSSRTGILIVLALAGILRFMYCGEWSLWEDEETAVYFSQNPDMPFASYFPIFFRMLGTVYDVTGVSVTAGRVLVAVIGLLSIALTYFFSRRSFPREAATLAALFLTLSLGHLFWSQSIRYYILLFMFQIVAMYFFYDGFEANKPWELLLSNVFLFLALWTHFSSALLLPVFVGHLGLTIVRRESGAGYNLRGYLAYLIPFALVCGWFAVQYVHFRNSLSSLITQSDATSAPAVLIRLVAYFGLPVTLLGTLSPLWIRHDVKPRSLQFLLIAAFIPVLELVVIAALNLAIVTWYYAFFALVPFGLLAGQGVLSLYQRGRRKWGDLLVAVSVIVSVPLLVGYYSTMHGDRPRWKDAARLLHEEAHVDPHAKNNPEVFATVPGPVAFYLGVAPGKTMGNSLVRALPAMPPKPSAVAQWFVVEASVVPRDFADWLDRHCIVRGRFEARTGPKDRTILVYQRRPDQSS
jgi:predicted membrane-bound mannosyltransferase